MMPQGLKEGQKMLLSARCVCFLHSITTCGEGIIVSVSSGCGSECMLERNHVWSEDSTVGCFWTVCVQYLFLELLCVSLWFAHCPYSSCVWLGISLAFYDCIQYVCVFVAASHRESLVRSQCAGELICIPEDWTGGGLACGEVDPVLRYCWLMAFSAA